MTGCKAGLFFMKFLEVQLNDVSPEQAGILVAMLPEFGFSGMEELETGIRAYAKIEDADLHSLQIFSKDLGVTFSTHEIEDRNWNAIWESNFDPVVIPGKVQVRAFFHPKAEGVEHEIIITPKMSFGTGHHATTKMMMSSMFDITFSSKTVIDFGTGTGILAILAEQLGASNILAIDNDIWSVNNALENITENQCTQIKVLHSSSIDALDPADIILANINRHILEDQVDSINSKLIPGGHLIISGLLQADYEGMLKLYGSKFGSPSAVLYEGEWMAICFMKDSTPS